jgi:hypothetical protein
MGKTDNRPIEVLEYFQDSSPEMRALAAKHYSLYSQKMLGQVRAVGGSGETYVIFDGCGWVNRHISQAKVDQTALKAYLLADWVRQGEHDLAERRRALESFKG